MDGWIDEWMCKPDKGMGFWNERTRGDEMRGEGSSCVSLLWPRKEDVLAQNGLSCQNTQFGSGDIQNPDSVPHQTM